MSISKIKINLYSTIEKPQKKQHKKKHIALFKWTKDSSRAIFAETCKWSTGIRKVFGITSNLRNSVQTAVKHSRTAIRMAILIMTKDNVEF